MAPGSKFSEAAESVQLYNGQFTNAREQNIYCYYWKAMVQPRALLLISTGFTEHCMVYDEWAREICQKGFLVFAHDHVGHGQSDGSRGYVGSFDYVVEDSVAHIKSLRKEYPHLPLFVLGHSMGGATAIVLAAKDELEIQGIVLIGPAVTTNPKTATFMRLSFCKFFGTFLPYCPMGQIDFSLTCQDEAQVKAMTDDVLRVQGYYKAGSIASLLQGAQMVTALIPAFHVPFCLLQGEEDKLCHVDGARTFYEGACSSDKFLKIYPSAEHSLHLEPQGIGEDAMEKTLQWLTERI